MNRWFILSLGIIANLAQGVVYAASVISTPMMEGLLGITNPAEIKSCFAVIFAMACIFIPLGMLLAGYLEKISHRLPIALGTVVFGVGVFSSGFVTNFYVLCITFGFMLSFGSGLAYGPIVANAVRWFPDKKGLASGLAVAALGFGPIWMAPLCATLLAEGFAIQQVLNILGVICFLMMSAAILMPAPPQPQTAAQSTPTGNDVVWTRMLRTGKFWLLFTLFFLGIVSGMMIYSAASGIFQSIGGFSLEQAAYLVGVLAVANALGRFLWGTISDYLGRVNALIIMYTLSTLMMLGLALPTNPTVLIAVTVVMGITYGGYLGLFPSFCAESFGLKNMAMNYAILFCAFSLAALVGPRIYASFEPQQAFFIAAGLAFTGCILALLYRHANTPAVCTPAVRTASNPPQGDDRKHE